MNMKYEYEIWIRNMKYEYEIWWRNRIWKKAVSSMEIKNFNGNNFENVNIALKH